MNAGAVALLAVFAQDVVEGELGKKLDQLVSRSVPFGFSGSVLVRKGSAAVLRKGYGFADRAANAVCTPATLFNIGSLTKQFTAAAVLRLEAQGKLATTDSIERFLEKVPRDKAGVQIHHLLTHTSGIPRGIPTVGSEMTDRAALVATVLATPLESKPGSKFAYSNVGYDLLAAIVEIAARRSFESVLRDEVFAPAEMGRTGFCQEKELDAASAARGNADGAELKPATEGWYSWGLRGAGGVVSSVEDLERWDRALAGTSVLSEAAKRKLFQPFLDGYAYGWRIATTPRGKRSIEHGGSSGDGFDAWLARHVEDDAAVVVLANARGVAHQVGPALSRLLFGAEATLPPAVVPLDGGLRARIEGSYGAPAGPAFRATLDADDLVLEALDSRALDLLLGTTADPSAPKPLRGGDAEDVRARSEAVARALCERRFAEVHALENPAHRMSWLDGWWTRLADQHGKPVRARGIGAARAEDGRTIGFVTLEFERGIERLRVLWKDRTIDGLNIGPPFHAEVRLAPVAEGHFVRFDLASWRTSTQARFTGGRALELEIPGSKKLSLPVRKGQR